MMMSAKPKIRAIFLLPVLVVLAIVLEKPILSLYDNLRLAKFAHTIATTDHVVASEWTHYPSRKQMSLSLTGEDARRVVQAVTSASSGRPPIGTAWKNMYLVTTTFFKGTNVLGEIEIDDGELFRVDGGEYRDVSFKQVGDGVSGVLRDLVCAPLGKIVQETEMKELESR
jgi:hypothetical protein